MTAEFPRVPVKVIYYNPSNVFRPSRHDPDSGINEALKTRGQTIFQAGSHRLIALRPTRPHHQEMKQYSTVEKPIQKHQVYWLDKRGSRGEIFPWTNDSFLALIQDAVFLDETGDLVRSLQSVEGHTHLYMYTGFAENSEQVDGSKVEIRGMAYPKTKAFAQSST